MKSYIHEDAIMKFIILYTNFKKTKVANNCSGNLTPPSALSDAQIYMQANHNLNRGSVAQWIIHWASNDKK